MNNHPRPRIGKTAKDKAKGHVPYRPNHRDKVRTGGYGTDGQPVYEYVRRHK